jgi:hypothetical protein
MAEEQIPEITINIKGEICSQVAGRPNDFSRKDRAN